MAGRGHNFLSRFIHQVALQYPGVAEMSFNIENALIGKKPDYPSNHVFISGLARSGTTILLQYLYNTGAFTTLTYADMPFVLMPNTWKKISPQKKASSYNERTHQDSIVVGPDSPEAFEEVFWRVFCGEDYIRDDRLLVHKIDADVSKKFKNYIGNVLRLGVNENRYLSKNNNNILRLDYLQKTFPEAHIIVPFRDPLQQSISLLNQHRRFSEMHQTDQFSLNYMNWLGHFEFGLNQKPFCPGDEAAFEAMQRYPKTGINFWLLTWKNYYQYASRRIGGNTQLFNYEKFCADPQAALTGLFSRVNVPVANCDYQPFITTLKSVDNFDGALLTACNFIYEEMANKCN